MAQLNFKIEFTSDNTSHSGCHIVMAWFATFKDGKEFLISPQITDPVNNTIANNVPYMWLIRHPSNLAFKDYTNYNSGNLSIVLNGLNDELDCWINNSCDPNMLLKVAVIPCCVVGSVSNNPALGSTFTNACQNLPSNSNTCSVKLSYSEALAINSALTSNAPQYLAENGAVTYIKITRDVVKKRCKRYKATRNTNAPLPFNSNNHIFNVNNLYTCSNYFNNTSNRPKILGSASNDLDSLISNICPSAQIRVNWDNAFIESGTALYLCAEPSSTFSIINTTEFSNSIVLTELDFERDENRSSHCCYDCQNIICSVITTGNCNPFPGTFAIIYQSCDSSNYGQLVAEVRHSSCINPFTFTINAIPGTAIVTIYDSMNTVSSAVLSENLMNVINPILTQTISGCTISLHINSVTNKPLNYTKC